MQKDGCIYILTNKNNTVLYNGVTSDLQTRLYEHQTNKYSNSFTAKYSIYKLVYFEAFHSIEEAIDSEKQIKVGSRKKN